MYWVFCGQFVAGLEPGWSDEADGGDLVFSSVVRVSLARSLTTSLNLSMDVGYTYWHYQQWLRGKQ